MVPNAILIPFDTSLDDNNKNYDFGEKLRPIYLLKLVLLLSELIQKQF